MACMLPLSPHHHGLPALLSLPYYDVPGGLGTALTNQCGPFPFSGQKADMVAKFL